MPIYEYESLIEKGKIFEVWQSIYDNPLSEYEEVKEDGSKIVHPVSIKLSKSGGFILNGSGFYATDYKSKVKEKL